jgi:hypothetical protein
MALSLVVDQPCTLNILRFALSEILEMRGSTWGFSMGFVTWKKTCLCGACFYTRVHFFNIWAWRRKGTW